MIFRSVLMFGAIVLTGALGCKRDASSEDKNLQTNAAHARHVIMAPANKPLKLAFITNNVSDFWRKAQAGIDAYEKETGVKVEFKEPASVSVADQNNIFDDLLTQGYDGIAISAISPDEQTREINRAAKRTNIICVDSDCPKSDRLMYIGTDNFKAGKKLGEQIVALLPRGGKMAVFVGTFSADNARQRLAGIKSVIAGHHIDIVASKEDNKDPTKARSNPEDVINNAGLGVNLLCGLWSYNGGAIAKAIESSGKKGKIIEVCFDDDEDTLKAIEEGVISCTVVQKPYQFGYEASKWMHDLATKGQSILPANPIRDLGVEVIDASNVQAYHEKINKMLNQK